MKADRITAEPFSELIITDYKGSKKVNEHGVVNISGYIPVEKVQQYLNLAQKEKRIKITAEEFNSDNKTILLYGILTDCDVAIEGHTAVLTLEVKTGTCEMEHQIHTRTFQDKKFTYDKVLDICNRSYRDGETILTSGKGEQISEFIVQYRETDWGFVKRLAAARNTVIVPDTRTSGVKYYFGFPRFANVTMNEMVSYKMGRDIEAYERGKARGINASEQEFNYYVITTRELYEIGSQVEFLNQNLFIHQIESEMRGSELYHTYYLKSARNLYENSSYNHKMTGACLTGTVEDIRGDTVKISIEADENKEKTGSRWFPFATVYSSPDGTGWYCMPEKGDTVRLCFPSEKARDAYVTSAVHEYRAERTDTQRKSLKNRQGKEICLAPDHIILTNNDGTFIEISDRKGIRMRSSGSINLRADGRVVIQSQNSDIEMNAEAGIELQQRAARISIQDDITFEGMQVKLH